MAASPVLTDLAAMNEAIKSAGALVTEDDGFQWVDADLMGVDFMRAYQGLTSYGYATGTL